MGKINCIGILTSGGDAPGMNAAIRAVTRAGIAAGLKVKGIYRGYEGLINNEIQDFTTENVSNIIQRGGTILKTARSKEFLVCNRINGLFLFSSLTIRDFPAQIQIFNTEHTGIDIAIQCPFRYRDLVSVRRINVSQGLAFLDQGSHQLVQSSQLIPVCLRFAARL